MMIRKLLVAACSLLAIGGANAAVSGFQADPAADATGTVYGSTDTFNGVVPALNTINGTTAPFYLEPLDAGLYWREFDLVIDSASDANRQLTATASLGGYTGTLVSAVDDDTANNNLLQGWTYTFHFTGSIAGDTSTQLSLGGFGVGLGQDRFASANLQATAVPEPETYAMLLAGLGVMGFVGRRRSAK
jgi:hypothetical protein